MKIVWTGVVTWAIIIVPTALAVVARNAESAGAPWEPAEYLWWLALALIAVTILFSNRAGTRVPKKESGRPVHVGAFAAHNREGALSFGSLVLASTAVAASFEWRVGVTFLCIASAWLLIWIPSRLRAVDLRSEIETACSPRAVFDLVSNPSNWSSYIPELTADASEGPLGKGSLIKVELRREDGRVVQAEERVVIYEPGRRFATEIVGVSRPATGSYDLEPVARGTRIVYTYRNVMPLATAVLGGRIGMGKRFAIRRGRAMARIKQILDGEAASPV
jgi:hypothetical protein